MSDKNMKTAATPTRWITAHSKMAEGILPQTQFSIYEARPPEGVQIKGGIVLIQEIFGVNPHIRSVAERYAREGYITWAPAIFDHIERGVELDYNADGIAKGRALVGRLGWEQALDDAKMTAEHLRAELPPGANKIAAIGFCWGGSVAWLAACRLSSAIDAAVSYYGRATWEFRHEKPQRPVILHFGEHDHSIPMTHVRDFETAQPGVPVYLYDAGHGFHCDARKDFNAEASALANERSMKFLAEKLR